MTGLGRFLGCLILAAMVDVVGLHDFDSLSFKADRCP
jgi:hypothetical protein